MSNIIFILLSCIVGIAVGYLGRWIYAKFKLTSAEQQAVRISEDAMVKAEASAKELILETRESLQKEQQQNERDARERRLELQKTERRLLQKEMNLEHKQSELDTIKRQLGEKENEVEAREKSVTEREDTLTRFNFVFFLSQLSFNSVKLALLVFEIHFLLQ